VRTGGAAACGWASRACRGGSRPL